MTLAMLSRRTNRQASSKSDRLRLKIYEHQPRPLTSSASPVSLSKYAHFLSKTQLRATIPSALVANPGARKLHVRNPFPQWVQEVEIQIIAPVGCAKFFSRSRNAAFPKKTGSTPGASRALQKHLAIFRRSPCRLLRLPKRIGLKSYLRLSAVL
jgi:hypothetical protein